jgi:hypothetical protein
MAANLNKSTENTERLINALKMRDYWAGQSVLLSELIDELEMKKDQANFQFSDWGEQVKIWQKEIDKEYRQCE